MSVLLNVCGLILAAQTLPDATMTQFYRQYYHCEIQVLSQNKQETLPVNEPISAYFPSAMQWWPVFTLDQIGSESYQRMIQHGIKPGLVLPDEYFGFKQYFKAKKAVHEGAIPLALFQPERPHYFASKAVFSTAIGLRPLGAFVATGWDSLLNLQPAGMYIVQNQNNNQLPLPTREISHNQHYFYHGQLSSTQGNGYQVVVNPDVNVPLDNIRYPQLGVSWRFNNIDYHSNTEQVETSIAGYLFIALSIVIIPLDYILPRTYPDILKLFGSSISWFSLVLGGILLLILIVSILRKVKSDDTD